MARILISGASGLIGTALAGAFRQRGDEVIALVRRPPRDSGEREWHPENAVAPALVSGFDAVIHLSGENIAGRWNEAKKRRIHNSRVVSTRNLTRALMGADKKPKAFVCASAIGYYGNRGDEVLTEESPAGQGFLADSCREWESATEPAREAGIRVVNLRTGIVLSPHRGALRQMLLPFRLGLGGRMGSGTQWWSWIHIEDMVGAVLHILDESQLLSGLPSGCGRMSGPVNIVAPNPATNTEFTKALVRILHRPAFLPMPAAVARLAFGELADEGILASARVFPQKLLASGFQFKFRDLDAALADLLR